MRRRNALIQLGLAPLAAGALARSGLAQEQPAAAPDAAPEGTPAEKMIEYLFVHTAHGCTLTNGLLRLRQVAPATLFFSDRPDRIVGHLPTDTFVGHWAVGGEQSFEAEPPNAALTYQTAEHSEAALVVVLRNPRLADGDLLYDTTILGDEVSVADGGMCSLFVDTYGMPLRSSSFGSTARHMPHHSMPHHSQPHHSQPHHSQPHHSQPHHSQPHHSQPHHSMHHHSMPHHRAPRHHHW